MSENPKSDSPKSDSPATRFPVTFHDLHRSALRNFPQKCFEFFRHDRLPDVILLVGVPGSGKTSYRTQFLEPMAKQAKRTPHAASADDVHTDPATGQYKFNPERVGEAHGECWRKYYALSEGGKARRRRLTVVDNTNCHLSALGAYLLPTTARGLTLEVHVLLMDPEVAYQRNQHGVPKSTHDRMARDLASLLENFPASFRDCVRFKFPQPDDPTWSKFTYTLR